MDRTRRSERGGGGGGEANNKFRNWPSRSTFGSIPPGCTLIQGNFRSTTHYLSFLGYKMLVLDAASDLEVWTSILPLIEVQN